jgi:hypothetical protein
MAQQAKSFNTGWLLVRSERASAAALRLLFAAAIVASAASAEAAAERILFAGGQWAAIDFGPRCEARGAAIWPKRGTTPFAGFAFDRGGLRQGRFYVRLSRAARPGASVIATIASRPFLLVGKGEWAWSRDPAQQRAMLDAARYGESMRVEARDPGGRRIVDRYLLAGAATAIDAAAADCARTGKSR